MSVTFNLLSALCILLQLTPAHSCIAMEEGTTDTVLCTGTSNSSSLIWQVEENAQFVSISTCFSQGSCNNSMSSRFSATYDPQTHQSLLTVVNVSRDASKFKCLVDGGIMETVCDTDVYVKPAVPTCQPAIFNTNQEMVVTCRTERAYPSARCKFLSNSFAQNYTAKVDFSASDSTKYPGYKTVDCSLHLHASGLSPGDLRLAVEFYPVLGNSQVTQEMVVKNDSLPPIQLSLPTAEIAEDCPTGLSITGNSIKAGSAATCKCNLTHAGFPPGQVRWFHNNNVVGTYDPRNGLSTLDIVYNPQDREPKYECRAETPLVPPPQPIPYSPEFAYGPPNVQLDISDTDVDLCPGKASAVVQVICSVAHDQIHPRPIFTITEDGKQLVTRQEGQVISVDYRYTYSYQPSSGGTHQITCRAENAAFSDLTVETSEEIEVREPPRSAPVLTISNSENEESLTEAFITEGEDVEVTCRVDGGSPSVSEVSLTCGVKTVGPVQDKTATLRIMSEDVVEGQKCRCSAQHVTNCYDEDAELVLKLKDDSSSSPLLEIGIGVGVAALVIISIVIIIIVICKRKKRAATLAKDGPYDMFRRDNMDFDSYGSPPPYQPEPHMYDVAEDYDYITPVPDVKPEPLPFDNSRFNGRGFSTAVRNDYITPVP